MTSAIDKVSNQHHAPAALYLRGKNPRYPLDSRLGGASGLVWTQRLDDITLAFAGDQTPSVQSLVRHYAN
jgi:hypothetical protein